MEIYAARRKRALDSLAASQLDGLLVTDETNVSYLTGFTGDSSYLLLMPERAVIISDPRYTTQLQAECPGLEMEVRPPGTTIFESTGEILGSIQVKTLGFEADSVTVAVQQKLTEKLPAGLELQPAPVPLVELRAIKDAEEIAATRRAVWVAQRAFEVIRHRLQPEHTEFQTAAELEHTIRGLGGTGCSFSPIVAVGERAALPHAVPTNKQFLESTLILFDWGAIVDHYRSDITRVLFTGPPPDEFETIYKVVLEAQRAAIETIAPGVVTGEVDAAARGVIGKAGYGDYFGHGLGHGVGLQIHEHPRMSRNTEDVLQAGMIVTVEPGIYLPGRGGVRLEDDVLVTESGHEVLTSVPKEWEQAQWPLRP